MASNITLKVRLGPLVFFEVRGEDCNEISKALDGYDKLTKKVDNLCSNLAEKVYPGGDIPEDFTEQGETK